MNTLTWMDQMSGKHTRVELSVKVTFLASGSSPSKRDWCTGITT